MGGTQCSDNLGLVYMQVAGAMVADTHCLDVFTLRISTV